MNELSCHTLVTGDGRGGSLCLLPIGEKAAVGRMRGPDEGSAAPVSLERRLPLTRTLQAKSDLSPRGRGEGPSRVEAQ